MNILKKTLHLLRTCSLHNIECNLHHENHLYLFAILVCYLPRSVTSQLSTSD